MLWGAVSEEIRADSAAVRQYFDYYASLTELQLVDGSYKAGSIRVFGDVAVSSGHATFEYTDPESGERVVAPQRHTFVYRRCAGSALGWEIIDHHSSQVRKG